MALQRRPHKRTKTRMEAAIDAMLPFGFPSHQVRTTVEILLQVYGYPEGWGFIEDSSYTLLIETLLQQQATVSSQLSGNNQQNDTDSRRKEVAQPPPAASTFAPQAPPAALLVEPSSPTSSSAPAASLAPQATSLVPPPSSPAPLAPPPAASLVELEPSSPTSASTPDDESVPPPTASLATPSSPSAPTPTTQASAASAPPITDPNFSPQSSVGMTPVEIQRSNNRPKLVIDGDGFLPSRMAAKGITDIFKRHYNHPWPCWTKIPQDIRDKWFDEFMCKFQVQPSNKYLARVNFEKRGSALLRGNLDKVRKEMKRPYWFKKEVWHNLCAYWQSKEFKKKSAINKANRAPDPTYTGGSITCSQHRQNLTKERGAPPSVLDLFRRTHQRKDHSWVNSKAENLMERFNEEMTKRSQAIPEGSPPPDEVDVFCDVAGGVKNGRIYGLGSEAANVVKRVRYRGSSSTSPEWQRELEHERDALRDELNKTKENQREMGSQLASTQRQLKRMTKLVHELVQVFKESRPDTTFMRWEQEDDQHDEDASDDDDDDSEREETET